MTTDSVATAAVPGPEIPQLATPERKRPAWLAGPWLPLLLLSPLVIFGLFGHWLQPYDPSLVDFGNTQQPPAWLAGGSWHHLLGTDHFGRDLLSTIMEGARVSLAVALVGVLGAALIGITLGMVAGYFGGWAETLPMQLTDIKMSIPATLLIVLIGTAIGGGLTTILIAIVFLFWADYARVVRGEALTLRERQYVALARVANCSHWWILTRHMLPNLLPTCIVLMTLQFGRAVLLEAGISFIGLGIQPPSTSWGLLVAEGRAYVATAWWMPTFPGIAITMAVLGANLFGDWLRDRLSGRQA